ncbi:BTAD domain-containing putative transcriptional regulator [Rhodococcus sp. 077-4]|uniref:BTAD domain-containing putative transcriptional regulator n=1 Tax=Rhodococcus sp. 077-4 TaxID=2789271 RepID=UPI0039F59784
MAVPIDSAVSQTNHLTTDLPVVGILGVVATAVDGSLVPVAGVRAQSLLVALALAPGRARSAQALIDEVWPGEPPRSPKNALQTQVSRLRSVLPTGVLVSGPGGYRLVLGSDDTDLGIARVLARAAEGLLASAQFQDALDTVLEALSLWRGEPVESVRVHSEQLEFALRSMQITALLGLRRFGDALPLAEAGVAADLADERAAADLMRALHGAGRSNDALTVFAALRTELAERLGTDPSTAATALNAEILRHSAPNTMQSIGLRAAPNALIGRDVDVEAIEGLLRSSRVTTVLGPGGAGKTRIAHELGRRAADRVSVAFVELASLRSGEDVASAIGATLGLTEADFKVGGLQVTRVHSIQERLVDVFSTRRGLLILDNCEHVIDEVAVVVDALVAATDSVTVLATSRSPMGITAESVFPLPSLGVAGTDSPATELFCIRARAVRPSARLEPDAVARLCRALDGMPLAIELAAARVKSMSVEDIDAGLDRRFALLRSADRTRPERHRTLHAVIDWSWNLLDATEQAALRRLCRFPAGFDLDAARQVAEWAVVEDISAALDGLVNQSMLTVVDSPTGIRYHMLETVREYGERRLDASGEVADVAARVRSWAATVATTVSAGYSAGRPAEMVLVLETEHDNLLSVMRHSFAHRDSQSVCTLFSVLGYFWAMRGAHSEVLNWAGRVQESMRRGLADTPDDNAVMCLLVLAAHFAHGADLRQLARIRLDLRRLLRSRTQLSPGLQFNSEVVVHHGGGRGLSRKLARATRSEHEDVRCNAYVVRSMLAQNSGRLFESIRDGEKALALARRRGDLWAVGSTSQTLASSYGLSGDYARAAEFYRTAADVMWEVHAFEESMQTRTFLAMALIGAGRVDEGRSLVEKLSAATMQEWSLVGSEGRSSADDAGARWDRAQQQSNSASLTAARAAADLADGAVEQGLEGFRAALAMGGWPSEDPSDPFMTILVCAAVGAHVLHGRAEDVREAVGAVSRKPWNVLIPGGFYDIPMLGAVACAVGSFEIHRGDRAVGLLLLAASKRAVGRQDFPSMRIDRHVDAARAIGGDVEVDAVFARAAELTRSAALQEILRLLALV